MTSSRDRKVAIVWFRRDLRLADNQALRMALSRGGQSWFLETLTDADLANNTFGWHWTAGCGADAAPFFRIFNPVIQGKKFDPEGTYVRRWVPELARLPSRWIHRPWDAPSEALRTAGVRIGKTWPRSWITPRPGPGGIARSISSTCLRPRRRNGTAHGEIQPWSVFRKGSCTVVTTSGT